MSAPTYGGPSAAQIAATQAEYKAEASKAQVTFTSVGSLTHGLHTVHRVGNHAVHVDEPEGLGGTDTAANPAELLLVALGSCQEITYKAFGNALGLTLKSVSAEVDGQLDLRGFYGVSPYETARPGFSGVQAHVTLETDATAEQVENLKNAVASHCPVKDIIENKTPVTVNVTQVNSEATTNTGGPTAAEIQGTQAAFTADSSKAQAAFKSISKLKYGLATVARVAEGKHIVHVEAGGGDDTGPSPVELVLTSLGSCHEITFKANANALGIPLRSVKATVTGDLDLRGFYGVSSYEEARPGYSQITVNVVLDTPATAEQVETLKSAVAAHCPIRDSIENQVPLKTTASAIVA